MLDYKNLSEITCVYRIFNNSYSYIGSTLNLKDRVRRHLYSLNKQEHSNTKLQRSYSKEGNENFNIEVLKELPFDIDLEVLKAYETIYHYEYNSIINGFNFNYPSKIDGKFELEDYQRIKRTHAYKKIIAINRFTGKIYKEYCSITKAAIEIGESTSNISQVCKGNLNYCKDYVFVYSSNYNKDKDYKFNHHWKKGTVISEANKIALRKTNYRNQRIYKYDLNFNLINEYWSRSECERQNGFKKEFLRTRVNSETPLDGYYYRNTKY